MTIARILAVVFLSLSFWCDAEASAAAREKVPLVQWEFCPDRSPEGSEISLPEGGDWTTLSLPHVFRLSGLPEKSAGFYRRTLTPAADDEGKRFYLRLEGAGSVVDVFVNGQHMGQHRGAFTAAVFDLTPGLKMGKENELVLRVTNRDKDAANCLSQSVLFYTNGGLYRPAWLIKTDAVHIFPDMGSTGVYLAPKNITADKVDLDITAVVKNSLEQTVAVLLRHTVKGPDGEVCAEGEAMATIPAGAILRNLVSTPISDPKLWDIHQPNLYTVDTEVVVDGAVIDTLTERTGFRTIAMKDGCFMLNGKELLSRGVCKHHQSEPHWNAMTTEELTQEMEQMVEMGCNTVRLAHYPHRRLEYDLADEAGVAIWAETGLAGQKWDKKTNRERTPNADGERITREMVRQNFNHPSIVFWSSGNETYHDVADRYAQIIREEDKSRLVTYASAGEKPTDVDFVAGNTYEGWYWGHFTDFVRGNEYVSETAAGCWITQHVPYGTVRWVVDHFEPEEYAQMFAEFRFQTIFRNNPSGHKMFLWWNFREFYDHKFKQNRNTKGIYTLAGVPKDYYYLYRAFLKPGDPLLHLCGRHHFYRRFAPDNGIKAYGNAESAELWINGESCGKKRNGEFVQADTKNGDQTIKGIAIDNVFFWKAPLRPGRNVVEVRDSNGLSETMVVYQKAPSGPMPVEEETLVQDLESSNGASPAIFIDRPVESQGPFYSEVDGSSDNTFDWLPEEVEGCSWITTKRLSDEKNVTDLSFKVARPATVYVLYATGTFPAHTLDPPNEKMITTAAELTGDLEKEGFVDTGVRTTWRRHSLWLGDCGLMRRDVEHGDVVHIPGKKLDYVVLVKER